MRPLHRFLAVVFLGNGIGASILRGYQIHDTATPSLGAISPGRILTSTELHGRSPDVLGLTSRNPEKTNFLQVRQSTDTGALHCSSTLACIDGRYVNKYIWLLFWC